jgi:site-specific recombinase XerD
MLDKATNIEVNFTIGSHKNMPVIWIQFEKHDALIQRVKKLTGVKFSASQKAWYVPDNNQYREKFGFPPVVPGLNLLPKIHPINQPAFQKFVEQLQLKCYSPSTIRTYTSEFSQLLFILRSYPVEQLSAEKLKSYILYCINTLKLTENSIHSRLNAIKFYFEQVLHREKFFAEIPRPKKPSKLPKVLNTNDISKIFAAIQNPKHKLMLQLCYGMGLRVSEIVNLQIAHIDSERMQVLIEAAKGKKDRYVNLPQSILNNLRSYYKTFKPQKYLFEGQYAGKYSIRSVQAVFKAAMAKAKVYKSVGIHSLRHSYATHLLESGTDIVFIQQLLGHDLKTTLLYTHVSKKEMNKIKSPLDFL